MEKAVRRTKTSVDLTKGPIASGLVRFTIPLLLGQVLQQFYNTADAWVLGNFGSETALAAVTSVFSFTMLIIGFFSGLAIGGGVVISHYFGAKDTENVRVAIHTNFLMGLISSVAGTVLGLILTPYLLVWMSTPEAVYENANTYLSIYFAGVGTVIMYNICMSIMRAMGDSRHPLYYLIISSLTNVVLDLLFVAGFGWDVAGAAVATVLSQFVSVVLCIIRMARQKDETRIELKRLRWNGPMMKEVLKQGLPTGIQNSVVSIGNIVVQGNINMFDIMAEGGSGMVMAGHGAYIKIQGFLFLPIQCMAMSLPTFISQNLGAREFDRAKKGAAVGISISVVLSELLGIFMFFFGSFIIGFFTSDPTAIYYGTVQAKITCLWFFLNAFSHCASGVLRGAGRSVIPMISMLTFWCVIRSIYVSLAVRFWPNYEVICWAHPITWVMSTVFLLVALLRGNWIRKL